MKVEKSEPAAIPLKGQHILFLSLPKHDGPYTSTPWQIATQLARDNSVAFVDHPYSFLDLITGFFRGIIRKRLRAFFGKPYYEKEGVRVVISPFVFPINFLPKGSLYDFFLRINHRIMAARINRYLRSQQITSLVYVNSFNFYFPDLHRYLSADIRLNIYHCIDPMVKAFTMKHGLYLQERAARESDAIIATAPALRDAFADGSFPRSYLVPNAANFTLFNRATFDGPVHEKVRDLPGRVIGYLGNIERRTDFGLLLKVMALLHEWRLVLAGPVERQYVPEAIFDHDRIHLVGSVSHDEAPSLVRRFDVAVIPFKCDEVSRGIYPLKLFEYMAAGKPIVTTAFNPDVLNGLSNVIHIAKTPEDFAKLVLLAYATDTIEHRDKRMTVAAANTWEKRAQLFSACLAKELDVKEGLRYVA